MQAWAAGGLEGERTARDSIRDRERQKDRRNFEFMQAIRSEAFRQVRALCCPHCYVQESARQAYIAFCCSQLGLCNHARLAAQVAACIIVQMGMQPATGGMQKRESLGLPPGDTNPALDKLDDEEWAFQEDPPELVEARKKLEQHLADSSGAFVAELVRSVWMSCGCLGQHSCLCCIGKRILHVLSICAQRAWFWQC